MKNEYHRDLVEILLPEGRKGLPLRIITRLVYNRHAGLFTDELDFGQVYKSLRFYLWAQAQRPSSPFTFGGKRGFYALKADAALQLDLCFASTPEPEAEIPPKPVPDYPTLF
ncbi:MAG: hypothetical protein NC388_00595 [Clostridium sp.]|nr:hypothetical protein [Clostridium sp.]